MTVREVARVLKDEKVAQEDEASAPLDEAEDQAQRFTLDYPAPAVLIDEL